MHGPATENSGPLRLGFLVTWAGKLVFEWLDYVTVAADHGEKATFWSQGFRATFWQSTLED